MIAITCTPGWIKTRPPDMPSVNGAWQISYCGLYLNLNVMIQTFTYGGLQFSLELIILIIDYSGLYLKTQIMIQIISYSGLYFNLKLMIPGIFNLKLIMIIDY